MFHHRYTLLIALAVVVLGSGAAATARADSIVVYTDRAAFTQTTTNTTNITFEGLAPLGSSVSYNTPGGLTISGVNFVGTTIEEGQGLVYRLFVVNRPGDPFFDYNSGAVLSGPGTTNPQISGITVTLPGGVTAVGSDVMTAFAPLGQTVIVTLADGTTQTFAATTFFRPERGFIGFTSPSPILSVRFRSNLISGVSADPILDNLIVGQASPAAIPEPATLFLLGAGLAGVAVKARRRRQ